MWNLRNSWVHGGLRKLIVIELQMAISFLEEFQSCRAQSLSTLPLHQENVEFWRAHVAGTFRLDTDASLSDSGFGAAAVSVIVEAS